MRVIKWLLSESISKFLLASLASATGGLLTISILILVFRVVGEGKAAKLEWFVVLCVGAVGSQAFARNLIRSIGRNATYSLRVELFRRIMAAPLADIERIGRSKLILALTDDIGRIAAIVPSLVVLCANVTLFFAFLAYLGWLSFAQLKITLVVIAVGIFCHFLLRREGTKQVVISRQKRNEFLDAFRSALDGVKELKLHSRRREQALQAFAEHARELQTSVERQSLFFGSSAVVAQMLFYVALGFVMFDYAGGIADRHLIVSFGIGIVYLMRPLQGSIQIVQGLVAADIALDRVEELGLTLERARVKQVSNRAKPDTAGDFSIREFQELKLSGVTHSYVLDRSQGGIEFVLGPIDLSLSKGEILFVIGGNGSGKTTFAKLLAGLYRPATGSIYIDDHAITSEDTEWYCQLFSAVFYDFFIFEHFLKDSDWSEDLLRRFKIDGRIQIENNRILKPTELSLGERKRLALMFACLDDKPIIILDEWAADQDPAFKEIFYNEILQELRDRGKLVVVISHDDRYFKLADRILLFERGKPTFQDGAEVRQAQYAAGDLHSRSS
jgi:putative ATP-binding cassette transporter